MSRAQATINASAAAGTTPPPTVKGHHSDNHNHHADDDGTAPLDPAFESLLSSTTAPFVHVTPRYNIDTTVYRRHFYDFVVVDRHTALVDPSLRFQLSRRGLLFSEGGHATVLIPLHEVSFERALMEALRQRVFFGRHQEGKCFLAWRTWVRRRRIRRSRDTLKTCASLR
jgi:hypothetical protein